jgi:4a-hydroxytetrahydrobiopterin dehydratase
MPRFPKLSDQDLASALSSAPDWTVQDGKLHRDLKFRDFIHAFGFMATAAIAIEKRDHHPEWSNVYNRVSIDLVTHDSGGITQADIDLAVVLDQIAAKLR